MNHPAELVKKFMLAGDQVVDGSDPSQADLYVKLITEEFAELITSYVNKDDVELLDATCDLVWVICGLAHSKGWDFIGAFNEVARSNMSKVDDVSGKLLKRADGKVLKPATFSEPELEPFLSMDNQDIDLTAIRMGM